MRLFLLLLTILGSSTAHAEARLHLTTDRPVVIVVNMIPHTVGDSAGASITLGDGKEGNQRITVRNLVGQELWQGTLLVKRGMVTTARWQNKELVVVDEQPLKRAPKHRPYNSQNTGAATARSSQQLRDIANQNQPVDADAQLLDLVAAQDETLAPAPASTDAPPPETAAAAAATKPFDGEVRLLVPVGTGAVITLVSRERSWSNVWMDGQLLWEYRGKSQRIRIHLPAGPHQLEFKDFQDRNTWAAGTLQTAPHAPVEIRFGMSTGAQAFETPDAWAPNN